jgi:hypothetical protein
MLAHDILRNIIRIQLHILSKSVQAFNAFMARSLVPSTHHSKVKRFSFRKTFFQHKSYQHFLGFLCEAISLSCSKFYHADILIHSYSLQISPFVRLNAIAPIVVVANFCASNIYQCVSFCRTVCFRTQSYRQN